MSAPPRRRWSFRVLIAWARTAIRIFYRRVEVEGLEHVATDRPTILAASHTNALGDVAIIVAVAPRFPHFLAASSWWSRGYARALFRLGGVLPVHRAADAVGRPDNTEMFAACNDALRATEHLAIFPAGVMHEDAYGRPLKTGAARIALGAADVGVHDVAIVPVGIVYESRGRFRSDAAIRFGAPITVAARLDDYRADAKAAVHALTDDLRAGLDAVSRLQPSRVESDASPRRSTVKLAMLTPVAAVGAVAHAPALLVGRVANRVCEEGWQATVKAVAGTALVPVTCTAEAVFLTRRDPRRPMPAVFAALAASGLAVLAWVDTRRDVTEPTAQT